MSFDVCLENCLLAGNAIPIDFGNVGCLFFNGCVIVHWVYFVTEFEEIVRLLWIFILFWSVNLVLMALNLMAWLRDFNTDYLFDNWLRMSRNWFSTRLNNRLLDLHSLTFLERINSFPLLIHRIIPMMSRLSTIEQCSLWNSLRIFITQFFNWIFIHNFGLSHIRSRKSIIFVPLMNLHSDILSIIVNVIIMMSSRLIKI